MAVDPTSDVSVWYDQNAAHRLALRFTRAAELTGDLDTTRGPGLSSENRGWLVSQTRTLAADASRRHAARGSGNAARAASRCASVANEHGESLAASRVPQASIGTHELVSRRPIRDRDQRGSELHRVGRPQRVRRHEPHRTLAHRT